MTPPRVAVLLRGVNVGGRGRLAMADLRAIASGLGHERVETVLQSGNLVLQLATGDLAALATALEGALRESVGVDTLAIPRTHAALREALDRNPYAADEPDGTRLHVVFLERPADPAAAASLDPDRSPGDRFHVDGDIAWLHLPRGAAHTKLTLDWLERGLGARGTARNARTVARLADLTVPG